MIGTRGVPARYGGFETAVEEIGARLVDRGHEIVVYCRGEDRSTGYRGMQRIHRPALKRSSLETLSHTTLSVLHLLRHRVDVAVVFNAANAPLLPLLRVAGIPFAVHVDGLEWKRAKWGPIGQKYYQICERLAVRWADQLIADAAGIRDYYFLRYGARSRLLTYGAPILSTPDLGRLAELGLIPGKYHLVVARLEPENHVDLIVSGFLRSQASHPLVVVGSVPYPSPHERRIHRLAAGDERVRFLGGVWDQDLLDALYSGAESYLHGHSVGGTNPSLLRAMGAGSPVIAWDVNFNREVLEHAGLFFADADTLAGHLETTEADPSTARGRGQDGRKRAADVYRWDDVAEGYEAMCQELKDGSLRPRRA
jgi:glycosyltransferase involved in cell wall biosynthesis